MLGDLVHDTLAAVGVTPERVERWLGAPCRCRERQERLNALGAWARRLWVGKEEDARDYLGRIMGDR